MNAPDLHVHSTFSTYDGFGSPKAVVARAVELGWGAVCLTEHGWMGSAPVLYQEAKKAGIKPILGCEMYVTPEEDMHDGDKSVLTSKRHLTVLALSREGYENLVTWVNHSYVRPNFYNGPRISFDQMIELAPHALHHNVILSGCLGGELCQCLVNYHEGSMYAAVSWIEAARAVFPNFYIELQNHSLDKFTGRGLDNYDAMIKTQGRVRKDLIDLGTKLGTPLILTNDSHFQASSQRKAHVAMLARKQWKRARESHEGEVHESQANAFAKQYIYWTHYMRSMEGIADTLPSSVREESIQSIHDIVEECDIRLDPLDKFSYAIPRCGYDDPVVEIRKRCQSKLKSMVARHGDEAAKRFDYELETMRGFADYLLIESDIMRQSRDAGIYSWTRGSAANSLVAYCLGIHRIDPIHYKLIFERFVNPARAKFPDIDVDFEAHRRDDVARMVVEHMTELEPNGGVMPICTFSTVANRNAFRMIAEAHGVAPEKIEQYAKLLPQIIDSGMVGSDEEAYELVAEELGIDIHGEASMLFDAVGNVSQHACAYVLGTDDRPLSQYVPNYLIASSNTAVTQYNMKAIEELGYLKLDLLKLEMLAIMHNVARMLGKDMDWLDQIMETAPGIYDLPDEETYKLLREGRTEGVHSFQGGTQRRGCIEVQPESDHDLVAIQALYRPSGTRTGYDKQFVNRKHGREDWQCVNELHAKFTEETFGFPIFQEQIMEMAFAMGMSGAEVDDLYKAIKTAKGAGRGAAEMFDAFEPTFRKHATKMPKEEADAIWAQWDALQGYTFNRGHASSYAILGLKMAYLKAHYPQEFFIALLDRYPDNARYLAAAIAEGYKFESPDVNASGGSFARGSSDKHIRLGLARIAGVGPALVNAIVHNQPFGSVEDLVERVGSRFLKQGEKQNHVRMLRQVGALESLGIAGDEDDLTDFKLMKFVPRKPVVFKGCKPKVLPRGSDSWKFLGLNRSVTITQGKAFCAKLFWIPDAEDIFTTKTSPNGKYDAHLLTVIDENGIPFDISVDTKKKAQSDMVKLLHRRARGAVICAEGQVGMPFLRGGNTQFKLWGIVGAQDDKPQYWYCEDKLVYDGLIHLAGEKRRERK